MNVLHIYKAYPPVIGGIEHHLRSLTEAQARRGLDVTALTASAEGPPSVHWEDGVRVIRARPWATVASTPLSPGLAHWVHRLRPDVTHLHFPYPAGELAHLFLGRSRATIVTYHSDIVRQRLLKRLYGPFMKRLLLASDRVLATSPPYLENSAILQRIRARCLIVPLGIDPTRFENADPERANRIRRRHGQRLVLFVGRLRYYKGLDVLIEAAAHIDARLLVIGDGPMKRQLLRLASRSAAAPRVAFLGQVPDEELPAYYAAADVVVLPSSHRSEAFGQVLLEAMAAGSPVVSTELGTGTSFVNLHGETGLVVSPHDTGALARAVNALLADPERRRRMGDAGRRRVREQFHLEQMASRTIEVYREALLASAPASRDHDHDPGATRAHATALATPPSRSVSVGNSH